MIEYTFCIQGSHRHTTVVREDILSAAQDAAWLLTLAEHERLLWLPPLPPLVRQTAPLPESAPVENAVELEREGTATETIAIDLRGLGRASLPLFLENAEQYWRIFQESKASNLDVMAQYCLMVCGAIDAITSAEARERVCTHLKTTSGISSELPPTLEVALEELTSIQAAFLACSERYAFQIFLCVLTYACLAVPIEQAALNRLRDCLTVVERQCSALVEEISYSALYEEHYG